MRVCIDINPFLYQPTGIGYYIKSLYENLCLLEEGVEVYGLCSSFKHSIQLESKGKGKIIQKRIPSKVFNYLIYRLGLPIIERMVKGDVDIMHSPQALVMPSKRAKRIITVHDLYFYYNGGDSIVGDKEVDKELVNRSVHRADRIICVSNYTLKRFVETFPEYKEKAIVIYPGFDYLQERKGAGVASFELEKLKGDIFSKYALFLGTIEERKNLLPLIEALKILNKRRVNVGLLLVGRVGYKGDEVVERMKDLRYVKHIGYVSDEEKKWLYKNASLLVLPSKEEGFGFPILEAMSHGVPVIASGGTAMEEIGGDAIHLLREVTPVEVADAIDRILEDKLYRELLIDRGYQRCKLFNWEETVRKIYREYINLLS